MNPLLFSALLALAIAATFQYFIGVKKNRWLASKISKEAEAALGPKTTEYVNIGGAIGHNFVYKLAGTWTEAKGTFTLSPRQSLLYLPFSLLIGVRDRFFVNLFTSKKLSGEAHLVEASYFRRVRIEGREAMDRREIQAGKKRFVALWKGGKDPSAAFEAMLAKLPSPAVLRHYCCYPSNRTVFIHLSPRSGDIESALRVIEPAAREFVV